MAYEYGESQPHTYSEPQRGWAHIPMNDNERSVSPISDRSSPGTEQDQTRSSEPPTPHQPGYPTATDRKRVYDTYEQEAIDPNTRQHKRGLLQDWWQEIGSALFSILCTVAIIIILYMLDRKRLSNWTIPVSLNAMISILSTAVKAGMILPVSECISQLKWIHLQSNKSHLEQLQIFDNASRGPAGSAMFFLKAKRAPVLSYLGCLIVVLALALDPFAQQILQYVPLKTPVPHLNSTVSHSQVYNWGTTRVYGASSNTPQNDPGILSGHMSGLCGSVPDPPFSCPGVNCTFPWITTIGICSKCMDVTQQTQVECRNESHGWYENRICYYRLPGSPGNPVTVNVKSPNPTLNISVNPPGIEITNLTEVNNQDLITNIMRMGIVRWDRVAEAEAAAGAEGNSTSWVDTMTAQECAFSLCPWSFKDWSHSNGILQPGETTQSKFNQPDARYTLGVPEGLILNVTDSSDLPGNQTFFLSGIDRGAIMETLDSLWDARTGGRASNQLWNSLYEANRNISATLEAMATGMTYSMMTGPNATQALGLVFETQTFIHVHWPWLSLAVVTVVAAAAILVFTIIKTRAAHQRAWKSSLVPLLYADLTSLPAAVSAESLGDEHKARRMERIRTGLVSPSALGTGRGLLS